MCSEDIVTSRINRLISYQKLSIQSMDEVIYFIAEQLKLPFEFLNGKYRGAYFCRWTMTFTKTGRMKIQARGKNKSFQIENGYDVYHAFWNLGII